MLLEGGTDRPGWPYDAISEVYVEGRAALEERASWMDDNAGASVEGDLFGARWFLAVVEDPTPLPDLYHCKD